MRRKEWNLIGRRRIGERKCLVSFWFGSWVCGRRILECERGIYGFEKESGIGFYYSRVSSEDMTGATIFSLPLSAFSVSYNIHFIL